MAYTVWVGSKQIPSGWGRNVNISQVITDGEWCHPWREVFAWLPVKTFTGKRIWLRKVWRRRVVAVWGAGFHYEPIVLYGDSLDLLCDLYIDNIQC